MSRNKTKSVQCEKRQIVAGLLCRRLTPCVTFYTLKPTSPFVRYTELFTIPSGISELDCATTKKDTAERSISIGREPLQVFFFFVLGTLAYFHVPQLGGSRDEKWRSQ